jgi:DNA-binding transcriptional regulator YdaS (Cro superfamily)
MTKEEAIKRAGSQSALARLLGVTRGAVWQWKELPSGRLYQLMVLRPEWFKRL